MPRQLPGHHAQHGSSKQKPLYTTPHASQLARAGTDLQGIDLGVHVQLAALQLDGAARQVRPPAVPHCINNRRQPEGGRFSTHAHATNDRTVT